MKKTKKTKFYELLNQSSISETDKLNIKFAVKYFEANEDKDLISNSYMFQGDPGIGKTFLADNLIKLFKEEVLYIGNSRIKSKNIEAYKHLNNLISKIEPSKKQVIYLDDLNYIFNKSGFGGVDSNDSRDFMRLLDLIKQDENKLLIVTVNNLWDLDEQMLDRIEVKITFDFPSYENKKDFLKEKFGKHLNQNKIDTLAKNSIGYNFRDLPEVVKLAYRLDKNLNSSTLKKSLRRYKPTQLYGYEVINSDITFKDVIGCESALKAAKQISLIYQNKTILRNLRMKRSNLLLFHGQAGTGKTYMAKAIAGEVDYPLINISAGDIFDSRFGSFEKIRTIINMAKRYKHCVIFIDEADKLLGKASFGDDSVMLGDLQRQIEGVSKENIQSIFILAINDINRFGDAFRSRFTEIEFKLPKFEDRLKICKKYMIEFRDDAMLALKEEEFARVTKGMSYRDLEVFWAKLILHYLEYKKPVTDEIVRGLSKAISPEPINTMFG